jgi:hypothetical protein
MIASNRCSKSNTCSLNLNLNLKVNSLMPRGCPGRDDDRMVIALITTYVIIV